MGQAMSHTWDDGEDGYRWRLSVIVPALNEAANLPRCLRSITQGSRKERGWPEVIVVDGGSTDPTIKEARLQDAKVVKSPKGRAVQMNAGAKVARGDMLLFLHADSCLPPDYSHLMKTLWRTRSHMGGARPEWGCFKTIQLDEPGLAASVLSLAVGLRTRFLNLPYGDQGLFVRTSTFREMEGYKAIPLMEDVDLVERLRRRGPPVIIPDAMQTSGRQWRRHGFLRTTLRNWAIFTAWRCGVDPKTLASWYYGRSPGF